MRGSKCSLIFQSHFKNWWRSKSSCTKCNESGEEHHFGDRPKWREKFALCRPSRELMLATYRRNLPNHKIDKTTFWVWSGTLHVPGEAAFLVPNTNYLSYFTLFLPQNVKIGSPEALWTSRYRICLSNSRYELVSYVYLPAVHRYSQSLRSA